MISEARDGEQGVKVHKFTTVVFNTQSKRHECGLCQLGKGATTCILHHTMAAKSALQIRQRH